MAFGGCREASVTPPLTRAAQPVGRRVDRCIVQAIRIVVIDALADSTGRRVCGVGVACVVDSRNSCSAARRASAAAAAAAAAAAVGDDVGGPGTRPRSTCGQVKAAAVAVAVVVAVTAAVVVMMVIDDSRLHFWRVGVPAATAAAAVSRIGG